MHQPGNTANNQSMPARFRHRLSFLTESISRKNNGIGNEIMCKQVHLLLKRRFVTRQLVLSASSSRHEGPP